MECDIILLRLSFKLSRSDKPLKMGIGQIMGEKLVLSGFLSRWVPSYAISSDICIGEETWDKDEIKENETSSWNILFLSPHKKKDMRHCNFSADYFSFWLFVQNIWTRVGKSSRLNRKPQTVKKLAQTDLNHIWWFFWLFLGMFSNFLTQK